MRAPILLVLAVFFVFFVPGCAADRHLKRGHAALAAGDAPSAQHHFERALHHREKLADDGVFLEELRVATRDAEITRGRVAMAKRQWSAAAAHFDLALEQEPGFVLAAEQRAVAGRNAAPGLYDAAVQRADLNDLPAARRFLDEALHMDPQHAPARAARRSLDAPFPDNANEQRAAALADEGRWSEAVALLAGVVRDEPDRLPARAALHATHGRAADDLVRQGRAALEVGDPDLAERRFRAATDFRPGDHRVRVGLRDADVLRGDRHLAEGLPGAAFLAYRRAAAVRADDTAIQSALKGAADELRRRFAGAVNVVAHATADTPHHGTHADVLARHVLRELPDATGGWVYADAQADAAQTTTLTLDTLEVVRRAPVISEERHAYTVEYAVPNPRLPGLRAELHRIQVCIADLADDEHRAIGRLRWARQRGDDHACSTLERRLRRIRRDLHDARVQRARLSEAIRCEPAEIIKTRTEHWPYVLETHTQTGTIAGTWRRGDGPAEPFDGTFTQSDATIPDPAPAVGLHPDPLVLDDEDAVHDTLLGRAATELAQRIAEAERPDHARALQDQADRVRDTDETQSRELEIAAVLAANAEGLSTQGVAVLDALTTEVFPALSASED